jgi:hypothetical protein
MKTLTYDIIEAAYKKLKFPFYKGNFNLNFGVIRTDITGGLCQAEDLFNDLFFVAYMEDGKPKVHQYVGTIDPGKLALLDPSFEEAKKHGTAIIAEGYHKGCYAVGYHGTGTWKHLALRQVGNMTYYRDNNRDTIIDMVGKREGQYFTNHHCASLVKPNRVIGRYSEGCAVAQNCADLQKTVQLVRLQEKHRYGKTVSMAVILESQLL